ncbi:endonuclease/exonuclease/phosphatase family protein [Thalassoglobus sp. JC818]|uniref:endonuclease/exonuclease/phosphatase family protein n=1 Tax=Thalassoglobus sp. JC818 TaxID=3232136 RepID=UPI0034580B22
MNRILTLTLAFSFSVLIALVDFASCEEVVHRWRTQQQWAVPEAHQAAAADEKFFYAISSREIAKYDRKTGERVAVSSGPAEHLNSGILWNGQLLSAHSNYPKKPEESRIVSCDLETMKLKTFHEFLESEGSLTWVVRHDDHWWCHFAFYGPENAKSYLAKFDENWNEVQRWNYPDSVIQQLGNYSLSGGIWHSGEILASGHDDPVLFRFAVDPNSKTLTFRGIQATPFSGQGFASDPVTGGLIGIHRRNKEVHLTGPLETGIRMTVMTYNIHHAEGTDGVLDPSRIANIIRSSNADLVALQEVDRKTTRVDGRDLLAEIATETKLHFAFGKSIEFSGGEYGNAILSRWPIENHQTALLPRLNDGEQRSMLIADVAIEGKESGITFVSTHLDHRSDDAERFLSVEQINSHFEKSNKTPILLAGDFNDTTSSRSVKELLKKWKMTNTDVLPTIPSRKPTRQIDFIFASPPTAWEVLSTRVLNEPKASDHLPVVSTVEVFLKPAN